MRALNEIIKDLITLREQEKAALTLLAVCPNSSAVLEAAVKAASRKRSILLLAATLNQVDYEGSYTGWTQDRFVQEMHMYADKYNWSGPIYPCLDHGGPWLKDLHTLANISYPETMENVKTSITACIRAGYRLLHIDPTVDRTLPAGNALPLELVVSRTVELIDHAERVRKKYALPKVDYEVGTEEVHGGLVDIKRFEEFIDFLHTELNRYNLADCWPCLLVAQVGTDLHTTKFKSRVAMKLFRILAPHGSMVKGHYTDWVQSPHEYPASGIGAANVGPEFTAAEYDALAALESQERLLASTRSSSKIMQTLKSAVIDSRRWKKWLLPHERELPFSQLTPPRQEWLLKTGSRYIWTNPQVLASRANLYVNLDRVGIDAHNYVIDQITQTVEKYISAFNLQNSVDILGLV